MPYYEPEAVELWVSDDEAGPFIELHGMRAFDRTSSRGTPTRTRVFNREHALVKPGERERGYSLSGLLDWDDAGQTMLRDAEGSGDSVWIRRVFPDDHRDTLECIVTESPDSGDADGEYIENAFTLEGVGDYVKDTGPANET